MRKMITEAMREQEASFITKSFQLKRAPFLEVDVYSVDIHVNQTTEVTDPLSDQ